MGTSEADCQKLAAIAAGEGIELASVCASVREQPKDLITNDDAIRAASIETVKRCLATTRAMGVDTMLLTIGALNDDLYYNEAYANALKSLQLIALFAEDQKSTWRSVRVEQFLLSPMEFTRFCDVASRAWACSSIPATWSSSPATRCASAEST